MYSNVWGLAPIQSKLGHHYFVIFLMILHVSLRFIFLKIKMTSPLFFTILKKMIEHQFNCKIYAFHFDWGGEYQKLHQHYKQVGTIHCIACPYIYEQNGIAKHKIQHLID